MRFRCWLEGRKLLQCVDIFFLTVEKVPVSPKKKKSDSTCEIFQILHSTCPCSESSNILFSLFYTIMFQLQRCPGSTLEPTSEPVILYSSHIKSSYQGPLRGVITSPLKRNHKPPPIRIPDYTPYLNQSSLTSMANGDYSPWSGNTIGDEPPFFLRQPSTADSASNRSSTGLSS
jgi:hypothetical protein